MFVHDGFSIYLNAPPSFHFPLRRLGMHACMQELCEHFSFSFDPTYSKAGDVQGVSRAMTKSWRFLDRHFLCIRFLWGDYIKSFKKVEKQNVWLGIFNVCFEKSVKFFNAGGWIETIGAETTFLCWEKKHYWTCMFHFFSGQKKNCSYCRYFKSHFLQHFLINKNYFFPYMLW